VQGRLAAETLLGELAAFVDPFLAMSSADEDGAAGEGALG